MLRLITVILLTCCGIKTSLAQDIVHINDMSFLKSYFGHVVSKVSIKTPIPFKGKKVKISFRYDALQVADHLSENDFLNKTKEEYNRSDYEKGDTWIKDWFGSRKSIYEPKFEKKLKSLSPPSSILFVEDSNFDYQFIVYTTKIDMGPEDPLVQTMFLIDAKIVIENREGVALGFVLFNFVPGRCYGNAMWDDFEAIGDCYAKLAKEFYNLVLLEDEEEDKYIKPTRY
jgi:hypothetical protein